MLEPPSEYTLAQVAAIFTAASGVTLADLVASLPTPNDFTLNDLLLAVLRAGAQWERLDVTQPALARVAIGGGVVNLNANLSVAGPASVLTFTADLPRGWTSIDPSGSIETVPPGAASALEIVSVEPIAGGGSRHTLRTQFAMSGDLRFTWQVRPGTTLGPASPSLAVSTASGTVGAPAAAVSVRETFEPNNDPLTAPTLTPERLYLSYLTSASDADYFRFAIPAVAGTRTTFRLSHLPADYDLVVYGPTVDPLVAGGDGVPLETPVLGDSGVPITHLTESLPAETLDDLTLLAGRRVVGVSAFRSTEDEAVVVVSDGSPGEYVVQVTGYNGATNVEPYMLRVETAAPRLAPTCVARFPNLSFGSAGGVAPLPADVDTVFLVNGPQLTAMGGGAVLNWFTPANLDRLRATGHPSALVRLENDPAVRAAYTAWNAQPCSTARANAVVRAITGVVGALRQGKPLRNVVLLGADTAIPFARLDDLTTIANEADYAGTFGRSDDLYGALFEHKLLSDDPYGTTDPIPYLQRQLFVPQLAVGRLVETPAQITGALDRFLAFDGVLDPTSARTSGYDFLKDGAAGVAAAFADAVGAQQPTTSPPLIGDLWTRDTLAGALGVDTGLFGMNGHADHFRLQPARDADGDGVFADADLFSAAGLPASLERSAVFSMGCHSGLSASDVSVAGAISGDWAQEFAARGTAAYVGNLGYGYGDTTTVAYSEALNVRLAEGLRDGLPIGTALTAAKQAHLAELGIVGVYDEKAMAELALYGLPMWSLDGGTAPAAATATAAAAAVDLPVGVTSLGTETDTFTGLEVDRYRSEPALAQITAAAGTYWEGPSGVQVTHLRPLQPKTQFDVAEDAHGVLITGLTSNDVAGVDPVYARPIVDSSTAEPELPFADVAFPAKIQTLVTQRTLDGSRVSAVLVQGQFFSDDSVDANGAGVQRLFTSVDADVLRSASTDRLAPRLDRIEATVLPAAAAVAFTVEATDLPGEVAGEVKRVLVAFRETSSAAWRFVDLARGAGSTWTGSDSLPGASTATRVEYFVQAVDEGGNVAVSTNKGLNYVGAPAPPATGTGVVPSIVGPQTAGWYVDEPTFVVTADAGVAVEVSLDGAAFAPYTGPISIAGDGVRIVRVRASNGYEATLAVPVDTEGPIIEIASPEAGAAYVPGELVPSFACRDAGIGVATCTIAAETTVVGPHTAIVTAVDALGHTSTRAVSYAVVDLPVVGTITIEPSVVPVGTAVTASAPFTDASALDTHTALWSFGDGTTAAGTVTESGGSGTATATHAYTTPGVYTVTLVVTDQLGGASEEASYSYVVVYDPSGGFVTGGGWITSPPGAYPADPTLTGKASFGFVSKYKKGQTVPDGSTEFHFRAAELLFRSTSYEWLVVSGARAQFKGAGSLNGQSGYGFLLTATDGQVKGGGGVDRFRIKIWKVADGVVVYDNQLGAADDAEPTTPIDSGSIVIRR
jgi:PKD repeat protein